MSYLGNSTDTNFSDFNIFLITDLILLDKTVMQSSMKQNENTALAITPILLIEHYVFSFITLQLLTTFS